MKKRLTQTGFPKRFRGMPRLRDLNGARAQAGASRPPEVGNTGKAASQSDALNLRSHPAFGIR